MEIIFTTQVPTWRLPLQHKSHMENPFTTQGPHMETPFTTQGITWRHPLQHSAPHGDSLYNTDTTSRLHLQHKAPHVDSLYNTRPHMEAPLTTQCPHGDSLYTDTDTDTDNCLLSPLVFRNVKYIFKSWNNQQLKLSYKRPTFTL